MTCLIAMNDVREFIRAVFSKIISKARPYVVKRKLDASQFYAYYGFVLYSTILQLPIYLALSYVSFYHTFCPTEMSFFLYFTIKMTISKSAPVVAGVG